MSELARRQVRVGRSVEGATRARALKPKLYRCIVKASAYLSLWIQFFGKRIFRACLPLASATAGVVSTLALSSRRTVNTLTPYIHLTTFRLRIPHSSIFQQPFLYQYRLRYCTTSEDHLTVFQTRSHDIAPTKLSPVKTASQHIKQDRETLDCIVSASSSGNTAVTRPAPWSSSTTRKSPAKRRSV